MIDQGKIIELVSHNITHIQHLCNCVAYILEGKITADNKPAHVIKEYHDSVRKGVAE